MADLLVELRDRVLYLTLNRPDKLNAMSPEMMNGLTSELQKAAHDPKVGAVVLTGAGRGFCSGGDITAMRARNEAPARRPRWKIASRIFVMARKPRACFMRCRRSPSPRSTDRRPARDSASRWRATSASRPIMRASAPHSRASDSPGDYGGTWSLTQLVGSAKARELYFLPDVIDANEAVRIGLANRVVPAASFKDEVDKIAKRVANGPTVAYTHIKANLNLALTHEFRELLDREAWGQTLTGQTEDHKEAVKAFLEKREPKFQGR